MSVCRDGETQAAQSAGIVHNRLPQPPIVIAVVHLRYAPECPTWVQKPPSLTSSYVGYVQFQNAMRLRKLDCL